jgi:hypothetical protein
MDESEHKITPWLHPLPKHWSIYDKLWASHSHLPVMGSWSSVSVLCKQLSKRDGTCASIWYAHVRWNVWQAHKQLTERHINNWWNSSSHISCHLHHVCILISDTEGVPSNMPLSVCHEAKSFFSACRRNSRQLLMGIHEQFSGMASVWAHTEHHIICPLERGVATSMLRQQLNASISSWTTFTSLGT